MKLCLLFKTNIQPLSEGKAVIQIKSFADIIILRSTAGAFHEQ